MENFLLRHFRFRQLDASGQRWVAIRQYIAGIRTQLPPGAKEFLSAEWHYNYSDHSCPHDSWIQSIEIHNDNANGVAKAVRLHVLGAFHDRVIRFDYMGVTDFSIEGQLVSANGRNLD